MDKAEVLGKLEEFSKSLPKREDGKIDYANSAVALVITVIIEHQGEMLLLKRSDLVATYKGKWNTVAGYYDEKKPVQEIALEEIQEETGISAKDISEIRVGEPFEIVDKEISKTWIVSPCFAPLKRKPEINLDFEHTEYVWIKPEQIKDYDIVPNLAEALKKVF